VRFSDRYNEIRIIFSTLHRERALMYAEHSHEFSFQGRELMNFLEKTYSHLEATAHLENLVRARREDFKIVKRALRYSFKQSQIKTKLINHLSAHFGCAVGSACLFYYFLKHDKFSRTFRQKVESRFGEFTNHDYRHYLADLIQSELQISKNKRIDLTLMFRKTNFSSRDQYIDLDTLVYNKYRRACESLGIDKTKAFFMTKGGRPCIAPRSGCIILNRVSSRGGVFWGQLHSFTEITSWAATHEIREVSKMIAQQKYDSKFVKLCNELVSKRTKTIS
jgi:hypothetical protein